MAKRLTAFRNRGWRIAVAILLAVGCCAMWVPVLQMRSPEKDRSEPYPCMDRPCGCASAEQCWKKCCCFTNQQKVAWAERVGVKVPDYVVVAAIREAATKTTAASTPRCAHCATAIAAKKSPRVATGLVTKDNAQQGAKSPEICGLTVEVAAEHEPSGDVAANVAAGREPSGEVAESRLCGTGTPDGSRRSANSADGDEPVAGYFCGIAALECQGLTSLWQILSMTMLPERSHPEITGDGWSANVPTFNVSACSCDVSPPEPPPRIGVAGVRAVIA